MTMPLDKGTLIDLYRILEALQNSQQVDPVKAASCQAKVRDALMRPDTEEIVDHMRAALAQQQQAAHVLAREATTFARRTALPAQQMMDLMAGPASRHRLDPSTAAELAVAFGRLVEAAHGVTDES